MNACLESIGIELNQLIALFIWGVGSLVVGKLVQMLLMRLAAAKQVEEKAVVAATLRALARPFFLLSVVIGFRQGVLDVWGTCEACLSAFSILSVVSITYLVYSLIIVLDLLIGRLTEKRATAMDQMVAPMVRKSLRVVVVILGVAQVAEVLSDKPLTSILAGLGVGGLAIALAAQETIKNFFGSLVIYGNKPFEMGERVMVGGYDGMIEAVGFWSTRIRTLDGHLVNVPNGLLANMIIQNVAKRPNIKRVMNVAITYDTPPKKVEQAVSILKELLDNHEGMEEDLPPRVYFSGFNDCSLNILVIYWYHPPQYWAYMAHAERLNLELLNRFNEAGIEFAFPTQTVHLEGVEASRNQKAAVVGDCICTSSD